MSAVLLFVGTPKLYAAAAEMSRSELSRQLGQAGLSTVAGGIQNSAGQSKPSNLGRTDSGALEFTPTAASAASSDGVFGRREGERHC